MLRAFLRLRAARDVPCLVGAPSAATTRRRRAYACEQSAVADDDARLPPWPPGDEADFDRALLRSSSLPPLYYTSPRAAELDLARVFEPAWLYAGPAAWVAEPGDYFTTDGGEGGDGGGGGGGGGGGAALPRAVVARAPDGSLRAFWNVCRHRAAPVATRRRGNRLREAQEEEAASGVGRRPEAPAASAAAASAATAAAAAASAPPCQMSFVCSYHGWRYGHDGRLLRAPKMGGVERLSARRLALAPLDVAEAGPLVFFRQRRTSEGAAAGGDGGGEPPGNGFFEWLGREGADAVRAVVRGDYGAENSAGAAVAADGTPIPPIPPPIPPIPPPTPPRLLPVARREWRLACDWKVYADNFLDGGYHVSVAHPALAAGFDMGTYASRLHGPRVSVQGVASAAAAAASAASTARGGRLGARAAYAWVHPNAALNRYGRWLDVNTVWPDGPGRCRVVFEWFLEVPPSSSDDSAEAAAAAAAAADALSRRRGPPPSFEEQLRALPPGTAAQLLDSCRVQDEDVALCEGVQAGLLAARRGGVYGSPSVAAGEGGGGGGSGGGSGAMGGGRYARQEAPMFHFHRQLWSDYKAH